MTRVSAIHTLGLLCVDGIDVRKGRRADRRVWPGECEACR